jgi:hypothetical protein
VRFDLSLQFRQFCSQLLVGCQHLAQARKKKLETGNWKLEGRLYAAPWRDKPAAPASN